jgi:cytochrome c
MRGGCVRYDQVAKSEPPQSIPPETGVPSVTPEIGQGTGDGSNKQLAEEAPRPAPAAGTPPEAFKRCMACHPMDTSRSSVGPHLVNVMGRRAGSVRRGTYGSVQAAVDQGVIWNEETLSALLSGSPPFGQRAPHFVGKPPTNRESDTVAIRAIVEFLKTK